MLPLIREPPTVKQMMVVQGDGERLSIFHYIGERLKTVGEKISCWCFQAGCDGKDGQTKVGPVDFFLWIRWKRVKRGRFLLSSSPLCTARVPRVKLPQCPSLESHRDGAEEGNLLFVHLLLDLLVHHHRHLCVHDHLHHHLISSSTSPSTVWVLIVMDGAE